MRRAESGSSPYSTSPAFQGPRNCVAKPGTASLAIAALAIGGPSLSDADDNHTEDRYRLDPGKTPRHVRSHCFDSLPTKPPPPTCVPDASAQCLADAKPTGLRLETGARLSPGLLSLCKHTPVRQPRCSPAASVHAPASVQALPASNPPLHSPKARPDLLALGTLQALPYTLRPAQRHAPGAHTPVPAAGLGDSPAAGAPGTEPRGGWGAPRPRPRSVAALGALALGEQAHQGAPRLAGREVGQVVVVRRQVHQPLALARLRRALSAPSCDLTLPC